MSVSLRQKLRPRERLPHSKSHNSLGETWALGAIPSTQRLKGLVVLIPGPESCSQVLPRGYHPSDRPSGLMLGCGEWFELLAWRLPLRSQTALSGWQEYSSAGLGSRKRLPTAATMEDFSHPSLFRAAVTKLRLTPWLWQRMGRAGAEVRKVLPGGLERDIWPLQNGSLSIWRALLSWPPPCFCLLSHALFD